MTVQPFRIALLEAHPQAVPVIVRWFKAEWPGWYGPGGQGDAHADLALWRDDTTLPIARVATSSEGQPLGIAALKPDGLGAEHGLGPFLSAFLVTPEARRQGVGTALVHAIEQTARQRGLGAVYGTTDGAASLLVGLGWKDTGLTSVSERGSLAIFVRNLR